MICLTSLAIIITGRESVREAHCEYLNSIIDEYLYPILKDDPSINQKEFIEAFIKKNTSHLLFFPSLKDSIHKDVLTPSIRRISWKLGFRS